MVIEGKHKNVLHPLKTKMHPFDCRLHPHKIVSIKIRVIAKKKRRFSF